MFFLILFALLFLLALAGGIFLCRNFHRLPFVQRIAQQHPKLSWCISLFPIAVPAAIGCINIFTGIIAAMHLILIWLLLDLLCFLIAKISQKQISRYVPCVAAFVICAVTLTLGYLQAHHVVETDYSLQTTKSLPKDSIRIVEIADSHLGVTLDGNEFAEELDKIQNLHPDLLVIVGDFVDDSSTRADLETACKALGKFQSTYGVYYVFGNHDKGYSAGSRDFSANDITASLTENHVTVLKDEAAMPCKELCLIGRMDKSDKQRKEINELTQNVPADAYTMILDHQPNDYQAEAEAHADLVLSGHTHGGQIFPAGYVGVWIGANDFCYGHKRIDSTDFIVTSGISGWSIPIKTGARAEYAVIDIQQIK